MNRRTKSFITGIFKGGSQCNDVMIICYFVDISNINLTPRFARHKQIFDKWDAFLFSICLGRIRRIVKTRVIGANP